MHIRFPVLAAILAILIPLFSDAADSKEYTEAVNLIKARKYGVAKILLDAEMKKTDSPKVRYALGFCCEKTGKKAEALEHYRTGVAQNIGTAADPEDAARCLKKLMALKPEIVPVMNAAMDLEAKGKKERSQFLLDAAKKLYAHALDVSNWKDVGTGRVVRGVADAKSWDTPMGAKVSVANKVITLAGPGKGPAQQALAILREDLGDNYTVSGAMLQTGPYAGFAFGYNAKDGSHESFYTNGRQGCIYFYHPDLKARTRTGSGALNWGKAGAWVPFKIVKRGLDVSVQVGASTAKITLPEKLTGAGFGLVTYHKSQIKIKDLRISK